METPQSNPVLAPTPEPQKTSKVSFKKIIFIILISLGAMGAYMVYLFIPEDTLLVIPQKEVYSWSTTSEPSKFRYSCTTGFIQRASIPPLGGAPYECSDGSRVKSIRELSVKCKTGYPNYNTSLSKNIPFTCDDGSDVIVETHGYPRYETILCQRKGEEPYLEQLFIQEETEKRTCTSPGNPQLIDIISIY